jgi:hypothetical protein
MPPDLANTAGRPKTAPSWWNAARLAPAGLFALALAIRVALVVITGFDGLYGQDAYAYYDYARQLYDALGWGPSAGPFYWPLGYPALAALTFLPAGVGPAAAQFASLLAGAAVSPLAYAVALELPVEPAARTRAGIAAGLIAAVSGQLLQASISIMADATGLFWALAAAWALLRFARGRAGPWLALAGMALGLATVTRWIFGGLVLPFGLYALLEARGRRLWLAGLAAAALFALLVIPQVAFSNANGAPVAEHSWVAGWDLRHAARTAFDNPDGHFVYRWPPLLYNLVPAVHPYYLFPLLAPFVLVGAWNLRRSTALLVLAGWPAVLYGYLIGIPYENFRFGLAYFPPLAVLAALGLYSFRPSRPARLALWWPSARAALLAVSILGSLPFAWRGLEAFLSIKRSEQAAIRFLQEQVPPGAMVITFGLTLAIDHYTGFEAVELFRETPASLRARLCSAPPAPVYVFVNPGNLESQWAGRPPETNLRWLREQAGLLEIGNTQTFTLYSAADGACSAGHFPHLPLFLYFPAFPTFL